MLLAGWKDNVQPPAGSTPAPRFIGGETMRCPCRGCTDRTVTCHSVCQRYKEWKKYNDERRAWLKAQLPMTSEGVKKREIENIRRRAKYGNGSKWGRSKDE